MEEIDSLLKETMNRDNVLTIWRKGRDEWNNWVKNNQDIDLDFSGYDFSQERKNCPGQVIDFSDLLFPNGRISFTRAFFGDGKVDFSRAKFGDGNIDFRGAKFGKGDVIFAESTFGDGGKYFTSTKFGEGNVDFRGVRFGHGDVDFKQSQFGKGNISFATAQFGEGCVDFWEADFNDGDLFFWETKFTKGRIEFKSALFGKGSIIFQGSDFGENTICFDSTIINGHLDLSRLKNSDKIIDITFRHAHLDKTINLTDNEFRFVVDFANTKITHHFPLDNFSYYVSYLDFKKCGFKFCKAKNKDDPSRLRRLKEIADDNKDYERSLEFHAQEMRVKRWHDKKEPFGLFFDISYEIFSDYGRSELRPILGLLFSWFLFAFAYFYNSPLLNKDCECFGYLFLEALILSGSQTFPFVPSSKLTRYDATVTLFGDDLSAVVHSFLLIQGLLSFIFLFLFGLALRNRFKL